MKLIGHLSWGDCLRLFNQGSHSFPTDLKKDIVKIQIDKPTEEKHVFTKSNESDLTPMERIEFASGIAKPIVKPRIQVNGLSLDLCCSDASLFCMPSH